MKKLDKHLRQLIEESKVEFELYSKSDLKKLIAQEERGIKDCQSQIKAHKISVSLAKKQISKLDKTKKRGKNVK